MTLVETTSHDIRLVMDHDRSLGVTVAFSDRHGGASVGPYESLNLAARVGDDPAAVAENRGRVAAAAGFEAGRLVLARQVHGAQVLRARPDDAGVVGEADVLVTDVPGRPVGILTADCVPVVLAGNGVVAVVHAGWRGLVAGAVAAGVDAVGHVRRAWVGPSIHACCYEVGPEVTEAFAALDLPVATEGRVDPGRAATVALRHAGVENIDVDTDCTSCSTRYFSYRRDGVTGRQGAFVWLTDPER